MKTIFVAAALLVAGCAQQPQYSGPVDPARAALVLGYMGMLQQQNAAPNPLLSVWANQRPAPNPMTCTATPMGLIPSFTCR
jgi:hypothetical protein